MKILGPYPFNKASKFTITKIHKTGPSNCFWKIPRGYVLLDPRGKIREVRSTLNYTVCYHPPQNFNEKCSLILWGLSVPIWKINFCSSVLRLSKLPRCKERPQTAICCFEWLGRLKCLATGLDVSLSFLSTSQRCSGNRSPSRLPVSPIYNLLQ